LENGSNTQKLTLGIFDDLRTNGGIYIKSATYSYNIHPFFVTNFYQSIQRILGKGVLRNYYSRKPNAMVPSLFLYTKTFKNLN
jgi:hypothetical protein